MERLRENNLIPDLRLLHFHIGSQINDIAVLKDALQRRNGVELTARGPMGFLDVGGGLGIDYTAAAPRQQHPRTTHCRTTPTTSSPRCGNAANPTVMPMLVSESGRAIASHFSLLVFDVLKQQRTCASFNASGDEPLTVRNLRDTLATIQELSAADAQLVRLRSLERCPKFKQDALAAFRLGTWDCPTAPLQNN